MNLTTAFGVFWLLVAAVLGGKLINLVCFVLLIAALDWYLRNRNKPKKRSQTEIKNFLPTSKPVAQDVIAHAPEKIVYLGRNPQVTATILSQRKIQKRKKQSQQSMLRYASIRQ